MGEKNYQFAYLGDGRVESSQADPASIVSTSLDHRDTEQVILLCM